MIRRTFGTICFLPDAKRWALTAEPHVAIKLKRVFGRVGNQFGKIHLEDSEEICRDLSWFTSRYPLEIDPKSADHMKRGAESFDARAERFAGILSGEISPRPFNLAIPLREYQKVAAELGLQSDGLLVADMVGLGKTAVAIGTLTEPESRPALIVTLTHLPIQWKNEIKKFAPDLEVHLIKGTKPYDIVPNKRFPDVLIMNYHKLAGWAETLAGHIRTVIFDEAQELRRDDSQKANAAKHIARKAKRRIGLSSTPVMNYGGDIFNVFQVIRPNKLGSWSEFCNEWGGTVVKDPKALGTYLREQGMMIRRTRADVGRELPPLIKIPHHVESDPEALNRIAKDVAELARLVLKATEKSARWEAAGELDWKLRQATGVSKAAYVADFVRMLIDGGAGKILLYGWHRACFASGTMVRMADGTSKPVEEVAVGDRVAGHDSAAREVLSLVRGNGDLYRVIPIKGSPWVCSANHILTLHYGENGNSRIVNMTTSEFASLPDRSKRSYTLTRAPAVTFPDAIEGDVEEPWLVGYWLGDGASNLKALRISSADPEVEQEIETIAARWNLRVSSYELKGGTTKCRHFDLVSTRHGAWGRNALLRFFRRHGLQENKHIPFAYKTASVDVRRELLAGLIDSDGHVYQGGSAEFCNTNRRLADDVACVARSLGLAAYVYEHQRSKSWSGFGGNGPVFRVFISGDLTQLPMRIARKKGTHRTINKNVLHVGFSVEPAGRNDYFGFEVDGDHLFLLDDFTIVHNCYEIWLDKLKDLKPAMFTGSESPKQKQEAFERFTQGDAQVLIMSLRAGAGLDGLQGSCDNVVFGELDWSPGMHDQAAGRVHRDGQKNSVAAYFLVSDSGSDPVVADVLGLKRQQSESIHDPYGGIVEKLTNADGVRRMAIEYLRQRGESVEESAAAPLENVIPAGL